MKKSLAILLSLVALIALSGCSLLRPSFYDEPKVPERITVYDADNNKVLETEDEAVIASFEEHIFDETEELEESEDAAEKVKLPEDAQIAYTIVYRTERKLETSMIVYANYDFLAFTDLPIIGKAVFPLEKELADWLRAPQDWEK